MSPVPPSTPDTGQPETRSPFRRRREATGASRSLSRGRLRVWFVENLAEGVGGGVSVVRWPDDFYQAYPGDGVMEMAEDSYYPFEEWAEGERLRAERAIPTWGALEWSE